MLIGRMYISVIGLALSGLMRKGLVDANIKNVLHMSTVLEGRS